MSHSLQPVEEEHGHATVRTYILIAVVLAIITIAEVAALYMPIPVGILIAGFLILSTAKFVMVVSFYMHLKYDSRFFVGLFGFFLLIAMSVAIAFIALFHGLYLI